MDILKYLCGIAVLFFWACEPEEQPIPNEWKKLENYASIEAQMPLGENYESQIFYSLERAEVVKKVSKMEWDFAWNGDSSIILNSGRNMKAVSTNFSEFSQVNIEDFIELKWDWCMGNPDSFAMSPLQFQVVYVVDLGTDLANNPIGKAKVLLEKISNDSLFFIIDWNGQVQEQSMVRDVKFNFVSFSILNNQQVDIEPPKTMYDLKFTQYINYFEEEETDYLVVGALQNPYKTEALKIVDEVYETSTIKPMLSKKWDAIGYDWKRFDFDLARYIIEEDRYYQIKTQNDKYFKLRFTSFTDENNVKGYPKFIFQEML